MQAKPTLGTLGKSPRHRIDASGPAPKAPTRLSVGPSSADLRAKSTERNPTAWASRTAQGDCSSPEASSATNIPVGLGSKRREVASDGLRRQNAVVGRLPRRPALSVLSRDPRSRLLSVQGVQGVML
jgi:hypothetical protein